MYSSGQEVRPTIDFLGFIIVST